MAAGKKLETATGLAAAIVITSPIASVAVFAVLSFLPTEWQHGAAALPIIVVAILSSVYLTFELLERVAENVYKNLEPFASLLSANCVLLAIVLFGFDLHGVSLIGVAYSLGLAIGYALFLVV